MRGRGGPPLRPPPPDRLVAQRRSSPGIS
jgi:hypothetical protein